MFAEVPGFYAAVVRADDPALAGRPVLVGGDPRKRGRVQSATLDALALGVTLEMSVMEALRALPTLRAVRTDMARYREVSRRLFAVLRAIEPQLEVFNLAACYADVGARTDDAGAHARRLIAAVETSLGLPLRVGIGAGKYLARIAAEEVAGERGVVRVAPGGEAVFLAPLPAARLDGVGRKTAAALAEIGGHTIGDVVRLGRERLQTAFGPHGLRIYACATGHDADPVRGARHPKSLSRESTLPGEPLDVAVFGEQLAGLAQQLEEELGRMGLAASRRAAKIRYADRAPPRAARRCRGRPRPPPALGARAGCSGAPRRALGLRAGSGSSSPGAPRRGDASSISSPRLNSCDPAKAPPPAPKRRSGSPTARGFGWELGASPIPAEERRKYRRIATDQVISFARSRRDLLGVGRDVSPGGIRFEAVGCEINLGDVLRVTFNLGHHTVVAVGRVVWATEIDAIASDIGIEFIEIDPAEQQMLEDLLNEAETA